MKICKICGAKTNGTRICQDCENAINSRATEIKIVRRPRK